MIKYFHVFCELKYECKMKLRSGTIGRISNDIGKSREPKKIKLSVNSIKEISIITVERRRALRKTYSDLIYCRGTEPVAIYM